MKDKIQYIKNCKSNLKLLDLWVVKKPKVVQMYHLIDNNGCRIVQNKLYAICKSKQRNIDCKTKIIKVV